MNDTSTIKMGQLLEQVQFCLLSQPLQGTLLRECCSFGKGQGQRVSSTGILQYSCVGVES